MKNLDFYKYESPKIIIKWRGFMQPVGMFKSAREANTFINDNLILTADQLADYKIITPDGILLPEYDPKNQINSYK